MILRYVLINHNRRTRPRIGMLWLAKIGDDSIGNEGEEYSSEDVFSHHH
jgi:hypothetical protein